MTHSVLLSNLPPYVLFSPLLWVEIGTSITWMLKMPSYMATWMKRYTCTNLQGSPTLITHMEAWNSSPLQLTQTPKLSLHTVEPMVNPSLYWSLAGALQYLTFNRPNIAYTIQHIRLFINAPRIPHFNALKRIIRYLHDTPDHGLTLYPSASMQLVSYTDVDWGGCPDTINIRLLRISRR